MEIKESQLDCFRGLLKDKEVTYVVVRDGLDYNCCYCVDELDQTYLTNQYCVVEEENFEKDEKKRVQFSVKENRLLLTIDAENTEPIYFNNLPTETKSIQPKPYDFMVCKDWLFIFLPERDLYPQQLVMTKTTLGNNENKIVAMAIDNKTPTEIIAFLEEDKTNTFDEVKIYHQRYCDYYLDLLEPLEDGDKKP